MSDPGPRPVGSLLLIAVLVAACTGPPGPAATPVAPTTGAASGASAPSTDPVASGRPSDAAPASDAPPTALLAAEGGDAVPGQLGTYVWLDAGSDAPWLRGSPVTVGAGEPLTVTLAQPVGVASWMARRVQAGSPGPAGAVATGAGQGRTAPVFAVPDAGVWTVEVTLTFADGVGSAHYFWDVTVLP